MQILLDEAAVLISTCCEAFTDDPEPSTLKGWALERSYPWRDGKKRSGNLPGALPEDMSCCPLADTRVRPLGLAALLQI